MLKPFTLNLAVNTKNRKSTISVLINTISVLLIIIIGIFIYKYNNNKILISDYQNKIIQIREKKLQKENIYSNISISKDDIKNIYSKTNFINKLVIYNQFPWASLFNMLESIIPEGILLSGLTHSPKMDSLFITGHAKSPDSLYQLLQGLYTSKIVKKYYIEKVVIVNKYEKNELGLSFNLKIDINILSLFNKQHRKIIKTIW